LIQLIYELIEGVWRQEVMPKEWTMAIIFPIHKKGDKTNCQNYRGISPSSVIYKVFANILAKRLSPYTKRIIRNYQCGFRRDRSTVDQIFALRSLLGKCYEYNTIFHELFIDFKQAHDSINREKLILILQEFKIPKKLINLIGMTSRNTTGRVIVQNMMTEEFAINKGLRQRDALSTQLFNVVWEKVMRHIQINKGGSIYTRTLQIVAYEDDVNLIGRSTGQLKDAVVQMGEASNELGLRIN